MNWEDYLNQTGGLLEWPYPVRYAVEHEIAVDVLVLGGGPAGMSAAVSAARKGVKVAVLDKTHPKRGGGAGFDHWLNTPNPCSKITAEDCVEWESETYGGYSNGLSRYIAAREAYDTLLEIEQMGAKIRDTGDEFKGAPFRDEETKFLFCYDYENKFQFRVWGTTFKPALYKEAIRRGVQVFDHIMATSLLTEGGRPGARVVGATGYHIRTGELYIFQAKATIDCLSRHQRCWGFSTELTGIDMFRPNVSGDGPAIAWRAGAEFTEMEKSLPASPPGYGYPVYGTGNQANTWHPATIVDANAKEIPWVDWQGRLLGTVDERSYPASGQKFLAERSGNPHYAKPGLIKDLGARIAKGEYTLPLYADLTSMPWYERQVIWGLMVGQEGKTRVPILQAYQQSGFDSARDLLQSYVMLSGETGASRDIVGKYSPYRLESPGDSGGLVIDWNLKTTLDGLYAAGDALFAGNYYYHACTTGRYAGRKAAEYAQKAGDPTIDRKQVEAEKTRIYAPTQRATGRNWKEMRAVGARVMQNYCGGLKNAGLLQTGLKWLRNIEEEVCPEVHASNPHMLLRVLETFNILTCDEIIINASLAREASSEFLGFFRQDYPAQDPAEWGKWVTIKQVDGVVKPGELPIGFWGALAENYQAHNQDYSGYLSQRGG